MAKKNKKPLSTWIYGDTIEVKDDEENPYTFTEWQCPYCDKWMTEYNPYHQQPFANYCPHCGKLIKKQRGEKNESIQRI